jgi:hypothetical protein
MRNLKIFLGLAVLVLAAVAGWQIGSAEIANANLQEDMRDMASQAGTHLGVVAPSSEQEVRAAVVRKAREHGIVLAADQVTAQAQTSGERSIWYLAADYTVPVNLGLTSFRLHFTPSSIR